MYSDSYDTSGGCTRVSGVERMLIRKISDVEKFTKNSRRFMCRRFVGLGMLFLCFCMELLIGRNVYASQLQSGINDETARTSSVVWQFADQYDYGEIDETLKELFPKERLDFKEILIGVLSGDITFSAQLLKQLVKEQFSYAFASSRQNLIHILMLAIMTAVFTNFARAFGNGQAADTGFYVMYLLIVALCLNSCQIIMDWVEAGISNLIQFMTVFGPIYFPAVAVAKGSVTAISFYSLTPVSYTHLDVYKRQIYDFTLYDNLEIQVWNEGGECGGCGDPEGYGAPLEAAGEEPGLIGQDVYKRQ